MQIGNIACLLILFVAINASGQAMREIKKDTSFNIPATFIKEQKKRPYITIATPNQPNDVLIKNDLVYINISRRKLLLDIYYPKKIKQRKPAILMIFGGGWKSGDKSQNYAIGIELAKHGYVAVSAEYRLSPEAIYPAAVYDLKTAIKWMRNECKTYGIDTNKIAVLGCSAGGQLAALIGTTNDNDRFEDNLSKSPHSANVQAVINIDGVLAFHHTESTEGTVAAEWLGGNYAQKAEVWEEASALNHIDNHTVPFLFINSANPRFHAGRDDMIRKMDSLKIYSEVHTIADTPHPFWFFNPWFEPMMNYIIGFLNRQFK